MTYYSRELPKTSDSFSGYDRVKIDIAQTSFFEGREWRTFRELNIAASATFVIKAVVAEDVILTALQLDIDGGFLRLATVVGGTEGGSFSETLPVIQRNNMSVGPNRRTASAPADVILTAGGTHTDGTEIDVVRVRTVNQNNQVTTVGAGVSDERGIAAGTYYFRFLNLSGTDAVTGTFHASWESRRLAP